MKCLRVTVLRRRIQVQYCPVDTTKTWPWPLTFLARPRPSGDDLENLQRAFDPKRRTQLYRRAGDTALFRVREAWKSGASLYLMPMNAMDFVPVFQYVPEMVQKWLEGMNGPTTDFERRIRLAEGAFIAICEGLLVHNPEVGTQLWRILQDTVTTQYFGLAEVDELVHMVFPRSRLLSGSQTAAGVSQLEILQYRSRSIRSGHCRLFQRQG